MATKNLDIVIRATDQASAVFEKIDRRVDGFDKKLATLGKISGVGMFRQLGDLFEGGDSALGGIGKAGIITGAIEIAGRSLQSMAASLERNTDAGKGFAESLNDMGRAVPIVGTLAGGFQDISHAIGRAGAAALGFSKEVQESAANDMKAAAMIATGIGLPAAVKYEFNKMTGVGPATARGEALDAQTKQLRAAVDEQNKQRDALDKIILRGKSQREQIEANRDSQLEDLDKQREKMRVNSPTGLTADDEKRFADVAVQIKNEASAKLRAIQQKRADDEDKFYADRLKASQEFIKSQREAAKETLGIANEAATAQRDFMNHLADSSGDHFGAMLKKNADDAKAQIADIKRQIEDARNDPSLTPDARDVRIGALQSQADTIDTNAGINQKIIKGQASKADADAMTQLRRQALENEIAGGNQRATIAAKLFDIGEKYRKQLEDIRKLENESTLTAAQRIELRQRESELAGAEARERREALNQISVAQGAQRAGAMDARFQTKSIASAAQVEVFGRDRFTSDEQRAKAIADPGIALTAKNTATTADATSKMVAKMDDLTATLRDLVAVFQ